MQCEKCKNEFERALELYNGDWYCPYCHGLLALSEVKLAVTDANEDAFKMSEICYLRALKTPASDKITYNELLGKATEFCREAARSGHPKALVRLGFFYDAGYFSIDETEAFKQAYEYYRAVINGKISDMRTKKTADYSEGGIKVKRSAAKLYLNLLKNAPESMRRFEKYDYLAELKSLKAAGLYFGGDDFILSSLSADRAPRVMEILQSCFSRERPPLFGLLTLKGSDFTELAAMTEKTKNGFKSKLLSVAEKVSVYLIDITNGEPRAIKTNRDLFAEEEGRDYCLYFFNTNGKHSMSAASLNAVKRSLEKGDSITDFARVNELISSISRGVGRADYVFTADDILIHKSKAESVSHALGDLIKTVQKNVSRGEK